MMSPAISMSLFYSNQLTHYSDVCTLSIYHGLVNLDWFASWAFDCMYSLWITNAQCMKICSMQRLLRVYQLWCFFLLFVSGIVAKGALHCTTYSWKDNLWKRYSVVFAAAFLSTISFSHRRLSQCIIRAVDTAHTFLTNSFVPDNHSQTTAAKFVGDGKHSRSAFEASLAYPNFDSVQWSWIYNVWRLDFVQHNFSILTAML